MPRRSAPRRALAAAERRRVSRRRRQRPASPRWRPMRSVRIGDAGWSDALATSGLAAAASSIPIRTVEASASRAFLSLTRQRRNRRRMERRRGGRQRRPLGSISTHLGQRVGDVLAAERRSPSASRTARSRTPRCRRAGRRPAHALAPAHVGRRAENHALPVIARRGERRRVASRSRRGRRRLHRLGQTEVQHLHRAVGATLMLAGFRSRWTMPFSCAASSASAICRAIAQRLVERNAAPRDPIRERRPSTSSMHERADAARSPRGRRSRRCSDDSARPALRLRARIAPGDRGRCANDAGQHFDGDVALERVSVAR